MKRYLLAIVALMLLLPFVGCNHSESLASSKEHCGLRPVKVEGKYGYIDKKGNIVINPQFDNAHYFRKGLAAVMIGDKWGFIDKTGKYVINPQFDFTYGFSEGLARVEIGGNARYINKRGEIVFPKGPEPPVKE